MTAVTAQSRYSAMLRKLIVPALRELSLTQLTPAQLTCCRGDREVRVSFARSARSTRDTVRFVLDLHAWHGPDGPVYGELRLPGLILGSREQCWLVHAAEPAEPVAERVLAAFRGYAWPAIEAALDTPARPAEPGTRRGRVLPAGDSGQPGTPDASRAGQYLADLENGSPYLRSGAAVSLCTEAPGDLRAAPALLRHLAHDPAADVRYDIARFLHPLARESAVRAALAEAAARDEDTRVRWAARWTLRLGEVTQPALPLPSEVAGAGDDLGAEQLDGPQR